MIDPTHRDVNSESVIPAQAGIQVGRGVGIEDGYRLSPV
jgi:hypothetical protein